MWINVEVEVRFDEGFDGDGMDTLEVSDAIAEAVSDCEGISGCAEVEIYKIHVIWSDDAKATLKKISRKRKTTII